jgi:hypothetical protein
MYAFNEDQVATDFYEKRCSANKPQTAKPATAAHRRRLLLRQPQQQLLQLTAAPSMVDASQQAHSWQLQVLLQQLAQRVLRVAQQLEAAAEQGWQQLQQRVAAAVGGKQQSAAWRWKLLQSTVAQQREAAAAFEIETTGSSSSNSSRRQLQAAAAVSGSAALKGVQLQRLALQAIGTPPEWQCESLQVGQSEMPIPAMKVELFSHMHGVLQQSYEVFREVRERLNV